LRVTWPAPPGASPAVSTVANTVLSPDGISVVVSIVLPSAPFPTSATRSLIVVVPR
jgi:hypothetical protein